MKQFTVKDFISYCNPCPLCGKRLNFQIMSELIDDISEHNIIRMSPNLIKNNLEIVLKVNYHSQLILWVNPTSNEYGVSDFPKFIDFLGKNNLYLYKDCKCWKTTVSSKKLGFGQNHIRPINLSLETFSLILNKKEYMLITDYETNESCLEFDDKNIALPLIPFYKIKDRQNLIKKIKTILTFS